MPHLHDSVTYCERCDQYVAALETSSCEECGAPICPDCAHRTDDPDLRACSHACAYLLNRRIHSEREASAPRVPEYRRLNKNGRY